MPRSAPPPLPRPAPLPVPCPVPLPLPRPLPRPLSATSLPLPRPCRGCFDGPGPSSSVRSSEDSLLFSYNK